MAVGVVLAIGGQVERLETGEDDLAAVGVPGEE